MLFLRPRRNHRENRRQTLQSTRPVILKTVKVIKNRDRLRHHRGPRNVRRDHGVSREAWHRRGIVSEHWNLNEL